MCLCVCVCVKNQKLSFHFLHRPWTEFHVSGWDCGGLHILPQETDRGHRASHMWLGCGHGSVRTTDGRVAAPVRLEVDAHGAGSCSSTRANGGVVGEVAGSGGITAVVFVVDEVCLM